MKRALVVLFFAALGAAAQEKWIQLFNGKDLNDWAPKITGYELNNNYNDTFRVENGVLKVSYDKYEKFTGQFGHIFYKKPFSSYRLRIEYRFVGEQAPAGPAWATRNSGVMIHSQAPETMGKDQDFPISVEVQFLGGLGKGPRTTGNLCTPGTNVVMNGQLVTRHCITSKSQTYDGDQWVTAEVEVRGDQVKHIVNGETVLEYEKPQIGGGNVSNFDPAVKKDGTLLTGGYICLQAESHPIEFRKVEILPLDVK
jgi:hypothetical protein